MSAGVRKRATPHPGATERGVLARWRVSVSRSDVKSTRTSASASCVVNAHLLGAVTTSVSIRLDLKAYRERRQVLDSLPAAEREEHHRLQDDADGQDPVTGNPISSDRVARAQRRSDALYRRALKLTRGRDRARKLRRSSATSQRQRCVRTRSTVAQDAASSDDGGEPPGGDEPPPAPTKTAYSGSYEYAAEPESAARCRTHVLAILREMAARGRGGR